MRKRLVELSAEPMGNAPAEMAAYMRQDAERWRNVIRMANVKADWQSRRQSKAAFSPHQESQ